MTGARSFALIVFDLDGTLIDSTYLHTVTWWQALSAYGQDVPMHAIHKSIGMGPDRLLDHLLVEFGIDALLDALQNLAVASALGCVAAGSNVMTTAPWAAVSLWRASEVNSGKPTTTPAAAIASERHWARVGRGARVAAW